MLVQWVSIAAVWLDYRLVCNVSYVRLVTTCSCQT